MESHAAFEDEGCVTGSVSTNWYYWHQLSNSLHRLLSKVHIPAVLVHVPTMCWFNASFMASDTAEATKLFDCSSEEEKVMDE